MVVEFLLEIKQRSQSARVIHHRRRGELAARHANRRGLHNPDLLDNEMLLLHLLSYVYVFIFYNQWNIHM